MFLNGILLTKPLSLEYDVFRGRAGGCESAYADYNVPLWPVIGKFAKDIPIGLFSRTEKRAHHKCWRAMTPTGSRDEHTDA
jgi:hypothetical protein